MLSGKKLQQVRKLRGMSVNELAEAMVPTGLSEVQRAGRVSDLCTAIQNWERGLLRPLPKSQEIESLSRVLSVGREDIMVWSASHRYAPMTPRKVRLVADLIRGRTVQDAMDLLKFTNKRAAVFVDKVLRSAIANADEQEVDVDRLYICEAKVDEGGIRPGTKRWRPKDRGRAVPVLRLSSHISISLDVQ